MLKEEQNLIYEEIQLEEGEILAEEILKGKGVIFDWWTSLQIKSRMDEKIGFHEKGMEFHKILLNEGDKYIQKMYKVLLTIKMEDKTVTEVMIEWAKIFWI